MKNKLFLLLFLTPSFFIYGQKDQKSQEILKGVSAKYKTFKSVGASFKVVIEDKKENTMQSQNGSITISGNKYNLSITGQQIISDGKTSWTYLKDANEVQINDATTKSDAISPANIFTVYENGFDSRFVEEKTIAGKTLQIIELMPLDKKKSFFKIQLQINKNEKNVVSAKVFNNNGSVLTYSVTKFTPDVPVAETQFSFDQKKYPGVEVVDLR
jgi:outer membrane lipoprotein-sorting protein